jgi:hypothetical protein
MPILKDMAFTKHSSISQVNKTAKGNIKYVAPQEKRINSMVKRTHQMRIL